MSTHEVTNQVPPLLGHNVVDSDPALTEGLSRWGVATDRAELSRLGELAGTARAQAWGDQADRVTPVLHTHSSRGERIDEVEFHPAWHELMSTAVSHGLTAEPWTRPAGTGAHVRRAAGFIAWSQVEAGHGCPVSMTYAAVPALMTSPELGALWAPLLASREYDFGLRPRADKAGAIAGMGMTEKQGGSDVRRNATVATPSPGGPLEGGDTYLLTGHKWFCSAPMSDVFLVLAQAPGGLTCFVVPRVLADGSRNTFAIQRLKDKLGNRSNASSEIELDGTWGVRLGDEGRGIRTILDMVAATRLDCVLGSASTMRAALVRAVHHTRHRQAFGAALVDQPLMRNVLTDLALESEAATTLGLRLAAAVDEGDTAFSRLAVAVAKFWVCKRTSPMVAEALECLGGNGFVEENGLARLYREAPLNSIWEGSGNVNALDVVRAVTREPQALEALHRELALARGADARLDAAIERSVTAARELAAGDPVDAQAGARGVVELLATTLQASLLVRFAPAYVSGLFVASRLGGEHGHSFGTLPAAAVRTAGTQVVDRAFAG
ncbi:acyl-CoA dehydrogenase family protein [Oryzihumus sp.]|uniref:acyl-CoA dehydrogenase family protein n=1 Tax=Oryzihumus sp. TaxID=1968903 RepID=UPI002ED98319